MISWRTCNQINRPTGPRAPSAPQIRSFLELSSCTSDFPGRIMILIYALELKTIKNQHASACLSSPVWTYADARHCYCMRDKFALRCFRDTSGCRFHSYRGTIGGTHLFRIIKKKHVQAGFTSPGSRHCVAPLHLSRGYEKRELF